MRLWSRALQPSFGMSVLIKQAALMHSSLCHTPFVPFPFPSRTHSLQEEVSEDLVHITAVAAQVQGHVVVLCLFFCGFLSVSVRTAEWNEAMMEQCDREARNPVLCWHVFTRFRNSEDTSEQGTAEMNEWMNEVSKLVLYKSGSLQASHVSRPVISTITMETVVIHSAERVPAPVCFCGLGLSHVNVWCILSAQQRC